MTVTPDFTIKRGDTAPAYQPTLTDANGDAVDVTGATVRFHMLTMGGLLVVDQPAEIVTPAAGVVRYEWAVGDTDTRGLFIAEWEVTFGAGEVETFPNDRHLYVHITGDLA